jgi:molybdate transport system substrate-binding protein
VKIKPLKFSKILICLGLLHLSFSVAAETVSIAVASNAQFVFEDLKLAFTKQSGHQVQAVFNSSGKFVAQIKQGAPYDVFMSADMEFPLVLFEQGLAATKPKVYALGSLVLWTMRELDLRNWKALLHDTRINRITRIAMANPKTAPYGRETKRLLTHFGLDAKIAPLLVVGESIAQTNHYIHTGLADLGFTAKAVVMSKEMHGKGRWMELPANAYTAIEQGVILLKRPGAKSQEASSAAQQFYDFLSSEKAQKILRENGYTLP